MKICRDLMRRPSFLIVKVRTTKPKGLEEIKLSPNMKPTSLSPLPLPFQNRKPQIIRTLQVGIQIRSLKP
jgi:hypothetical protein